MTTSTAPADAHTDSIERFLDLIENTRWDTLPADAQAAARVFFMDTVGVACAGKLAPRMDAMVEAASRWGTGGDQGVAIWNTGRRAAPPTAALLNGYQCHALEYDCVYEPGVVLPAAPILSALLAHAEVLAGQGRAPSGSQLLNAFVVGIEVSCTLAAACRSAMIFFRPSTTGVFSALAAIASISPLPRDALRNAFGIAYSQMCGPMQAHEEGSMMLAMQMGFAARNALQAYDMASLGITGPAQVIDGRFGFFNIFERGGDMPAALTRLAAPWKVTQLSHKPFPSGRVTHGAIHGLRLLQAELGLARDTVGEQVTRITVGMPPLGVRLVGRPMITNPPPNYARLCTPFVSASELIYGGVDPRSFVPERLADPAIDALARKIAVVEVPNDDPNAFYPQSLRLELADGRVIERDVPHAWGHPLAPLTPAERDDKFRLCWRLTRGGGASAEAEMEEALGMLKGLDQAGDCKALLSLVAGADVP
ncbi:MAG: MmgE/PrpD family protein [Gammaproteobacteria bacterium]|nr:MmgE/PrpD family protein [Gammaproteobacteria bacterium]MBU1440885.1 MmgE/PrpD family protein [Gammaproteobacteria bacterium]MBU2284913.1 MmgE/PrpD family protein [Gammaproteobacteria bacterium]MBU2407998.1 MmgE/PrpD family protein [Gammaproteobacteria bacterium]